jgi:type IV pilus assembly protein PilB
MIKEEFLELVSKTGLATIKDLRRISATDKDKDRIGEADLLELPNFDELKFANMMSEKFQLTFADLSMARISPDVLSRIQKRNVVRTRLIPIQESEDKVIFTSFDPTAASQLKFASDLLNKRGEFVLTTISCWMKLFDSVRLTVEEVVETVKELHDIQSQDVDVKAEDISADVVTFVNKVLADAYVRKASDIHMEPYEKKFRVRFRVDGNLVEVNQPPKSMMPAVISRIKILAKLDISEKRKPQDGRIKLSIAGRAIDYRVSSLPTIFGEKIVLRLLDASSLQLDMTKLGFLSDQLKIFQEGINQPYGMCLVTGPTGSGKTTTLYSALSSLNKPDTNISTAEDPCEYNLEGINQVNVRKDIGLTFAAALKSFLRQDPDIIMVGEIRDLEVGEIAVEAALTGHMVLSTLHTNDASSTITRLLNLGIEPFLVVAALNVVVAQRLLKRICPHCREPVKDAEKSLIACGVTPESAKKITVYKGRGCHECNNTGYKGRCAVHEVLPMTPAIKELVLNNGSADDIKRQAIVDGMVTLRMAAIIKVAQGVTTLEEAVSNSAADNV